MVLKITPAEASYLMIYVGILGIVGRLVASWMSDALGRRLSGILIGRGGAVAMTLAGYFHNLYIGGVSVFVALIMIQRLIESGNVNPVKPFRRAPFGRAGTCPMALTVRSAPPPSSGNIRRVPNRASAF